MEKINKYLNKNEKKKIIVFELNMNCNIKNILVTHYLNPTTYRNT